MNPEDFEYAGECAVCGKMLDMSEAGYRGRVILHPTWNIEYLEQEKE